jgi:hypothetical protein
VTVELQRLSTGRSRNTIYSPGFPSMLHLANFRESRCTRLTSPVMPDIRFLSSHWHLEKKELEVTRGVEDHAEYIAAELALGCHNALEVVHRNGNLGPSREKREGEGWSIPMQHSGSTR